MPDPTEPKHIITLAGKGTISAGSAGHSQEPPASLVGSPDSGPETVGAERRMVMTAADGRRYSCRLGGAYGTPDDGVAAASPDALTSAAAAVLAQGGKMPMPDIRAQDVLGLLFGTRTGLAGPPRPFELLEKLSSTCLYRQEGLWTYEVCYKKQVRQFRQEAGVKAEDFSCGKYAGDEAQDEGLKFDASSHPTPIRYVSHVFTGGAECVMTGGPRSAEVRFTCLPDTADNAIVSIREFPTCNYVMTVTTPFLCAHPDFKPPPETRIHTACEPLDAVGSVEADGARAAAGSSTEAVGSGVPAPGGDQHGGEL